MELNKNIIVFIATALAVAMLFSCRNKIEDIEAISQLDSLPVESISGVKLTYTDSGILKVRLNAPRMDNYNTENPYMEMPEGMHVDFFDNGGNIVSRMDARYAIKYEKEDIFIARRKVVVVNERGEQLNTEVLRWDRKERMIYTDGFVQITTPTEIMTGNGLEADEAFDNWKILDPVGTFYLQTESDSTDASDPSAEKPLTLTDPE